MLAGLYAYSATTEHQQALFRLDINHNFANNRPILTDLVPSESLWVWHDLYIKSQNFLGEDPQTPPLGFSPAALADVPQQLIFATEKN